MSGALRPWRVTFTTATGTSGSVTLDAVSTEALAQQLMDHPWVIVRSAEGAITGVSLVGGTFTVPAVPWPVAVTDERRR